ncbi:TIGR03759 family integrating conjugative element protein [Pseudomonas quasicaspiana]|uniref:TIGR03759 family integrating conjugative element protein n=1 Tax=Pseudomonas quasicaspiana TaxID=2829821 RepID=UPI001E301E99|nr:TIGR03759 family integrating conjugative element protein [Pseudomonas quasicaspiana]MCD5976764.1 TIGR03759 family integrating conjugative element protein [Pseudomonas quasicaspiana]
MRFLALMTLLFAFVTPAHAEDAHSGISLSQNTANQSEQSTQSKANQWGLQVDEWDRFKQLMKGPLGVYSPNLDPLSALGIEAKNEEERTRYAELQVQMESARVIKLLAYQNAYDQAYKRLYPDILPVILVNQDQTSKPVTSSSSGRLAVFVELNCPACEAQVKSLQRDAQRFDIYLLGSKGNDDALRAWALKAGIEPDRVRSRQITLNHDGGRWITIGGSGKFPAVLRQDNGRWVRQ